DRVGRAAASLRRLGLGRGDRVVLMMRNRPEFHVLDMAVACLGATPISIYNSSSPEQIAYLAAHCGARLGIVEDAGFLARFREIRDRMPKLAALGIVDPTDAPESELGFTWDSLLESAPLELDECAGTARPEDIATVIYTSGT